MFAAWPLSTRRRSRGSTSRCCCPVRADPASGGLRVSQQDGGPALARALGLGLFFGGFVPALVFGVALGNLLLGVPFRFDGDHAHLLHGIFFGLLNPFALLAGWCRGDAGDARRHLSAECEPRAKSLEARARPCGAASPAIVFIPGCSPRRASGSRRGSTVSGIASMPPADSAFSAPYRQDRRARARRVGSANYLEVFPGRVAAPAAALRLRLAPGTRRHSARRWPAAALLLSLNPWRRPSPPASCSLPAFALFPFILPS